MVGRAWGEGPPTPPFSGRERGKGTCPGLAWARRSQYLSRSSGPAPTPSLCPEERPGVQPAPQERRLWASVQGTGPLHTQPGPTLGLVFCCHCL